MDAAKHYSQAMELNHICPELDTWEIQDRLDRLFH
jgi:hypothetical protein